MDEVNITTFCDQPLNEDEYSSTHKPFFAATADSASTSRTRPAVNRERDIRDAKGLRVARVTRVRRLVFADGAGEVDAGAEDEDDEAASTTTFVASAATDDDDEDDEDDDDDVAAAAGCCHSVRVIKSTRRASFVTASIVGSCPALLRSSTRRLW